MLKLHPIVVLTRFACLCCQNDEYVLMSRYDAESGKAARVGVPLASAGRMGMLGSSPRHYTGDGDAPVPAADAPRLNLSAFKKKVAPLIAEFFDSEDADEVAR